MPLEQPASAEELIVHTDGPECMPNGGHIDGNDWLAQLFFERWKNIECREVGTGLNDGVYIVAIQLIKDDINYL